MSMHKGLLGQSEGGASVDQTLGDYITRKYRQIALEEVAQERKLAFEEWLKTNPFFTNTTDKDIRRWLEAYWNAAQIEATQDKK